MKDEIVHHLDSTFAILLVALVFLTNITIGVIQRHGGQGFLPDVATIGLGILTSMGVLIGLLGLLVRSWFWKSLGWFVVFWVLLMNVVTQVAILVAVFAGARPWLGEATRATLGSVWFWGGALPLSTCAVALWLSFYVTLNKYRNRLATAYFKDDELEGLMGSRKMLVIVVGVAALVTVLALTVLTQAASSH
jgi:hypothetical protein